MNEKDRIDYVRKTCVVDFFEILKRELQWNEAGQMERKMREWKNGIIKKQKREQINRKKRIRWIKRFLFAMLIGVFALLIYLIVMLCSLITNTFTSSEKDGKSSEIIQEEILDKNTEKDTTSLSREELVRKQIEDFVSQHGLSIEDYPETLIESLIANPEKEEFVLNYPFKKNTYSNQRLAGSIQQSQVPLFMQWDDRWGYYPYGNGIIGVIGCGPTSLSMVALHLLQDAKLTPIYMADYAMENGYYEEGIGTAWDLMTKGARSLGLKVQEVTLDENVVMRHLKQGRPIICAMGPGDFTTAGHFIVMVAEENGKIRINDCNSISRSAKLWEFEEIKYQIRNMWAYSVK